ncbi:hypothetical protein NQ314_005072 [Rhamnusium bicolor]|uniref:CCHC-type domain-containing protein n=1 Tax=Rhamnusium bicolor TaxID=1586634 RepID=A0AAV8ZI14_9CUCU|nr:hypothetical protein NQ314_005072 [Rhamnusium bicolor]
MPQCWEIDITTTKEDVEGSIAAALTNEDKENINVKALRTTRNGSQIATVTIPTGEPDTLIKEGKIRIGWVVCRVRPRVEVTRCINCLKLGHNVTQCKETKEEKRRCLKCTQTGHMVKECEGKASAPYVK